MIIYDEAITNKNIFIPDTNKNNNTKESNESTANNLESLWLEGIDPTWYKYFYQNDIKFNIKNLINELHKDYSTKKITPPITNITCDKNNDACKEILTQNPVTNGNKKNINLKKKKNPSTKKSYLKYLRNLINELNKKFKILLKKLTHTNMIKHNYSAQHAIPDQKTKDIDVLPDTDIE